jgi:glycine rich protein
VATADLAATPGESLFVRVGGTGGVRSNSANGAGGANGGGGGGGEIDSTGGGGASDVRTGAGLDSRVVVAGGGGGSGEDATTNGGDAGVEGAADNQCPGGGGGTATAGGAGGANGTLGIGGGGHGGGGGGGLYGGGSGYDSGTYGSSDCDFWSSGGGGGSSGFGAGTSATSLAIDTSRAPKVTLSYFPPAATTPPTTTDTTGQTTPPPPTPAFGSVSLPAVQHGTAVIATGRIGQDRSTVKAQLLWRKHPKSKRVVLGTKIKAPVKAGSLALTIKLNKTGRKQLKRLHKLKLQLVITVTPPSGAVVKITKNVTLKR